MSQNFCNHCIEHVNFNISANFYDDWGINNEVMRGGYHHLPPPKAEGSKRPMSKRVKVLVVSFQTFIYLFKILKTIYKKKQSHTTREGAEGKRLKYK